MHEKLVCINNDFHDVLMQSIFRGSSLRDTSADVVFMHVFNQKHSTLDSSTYSGCALRLYD